MDEIEKIAAKLKELSERYDTNALLEGIVAILDRASKALQDGRVNLIEAVGIGMAVLKLISTAARKD